MRYLCLFLAALTALAGAQTAAAKTKTIVFKPAQMQAIKTAHGSCPSVSLVTSRSDAYRCMEAHSIHDPCFLLDPTTVACPLKATVNRGIRMTLEAPLPRRTPSRSPGNHPWLMTLASGATCEVNTGTMVAGYPFSCTGDTVCAAPEPPAGAAAMFVSCGHPVNGTHVTSPARYLVKTLYL